tara:strand:+ start:5580 stop:8204 length:2625 start_codon:yes stop_codon:yes gene_type:complete
MSIFSKISEGMHERKEFRQGQRQQMAQAFADYKAANPYATAADFQSFVDSYSGGNNYISGGAPSASVRNRIAAENLRKKKEEEYNTAIANMIKKKQTTDMFGSEIEDFLLASGGNVEKARKDFFNLYPEFRELDFENVEGQFNIEKYNRLKREKLAANYENAMKFIENAEDPNNINVSLFADMYGLGDGIAKEVLDQAKVKWNEEQQVKKDNFMSTVNARVRELAKDATITPTNLLSTLESEFGGNPLWDKTDTNFINGVVKEGENLLAKEKDVRFKALLTEAQGEARSLEGIYSAQGQDVSQIEKDLRSKYSYLLDSEDKDFFDKLFADRDWLDQIVDRASTTQSIATQNRQDLAQQNAYQAVRDAIIRGDDPSTLLATARSILPEEFKDILGKGSVGIPDELATMITDATEKYELKVDRERSDELSGLETKLGNEQYANLIKGNLMTQGIESAKEYIDSVLATQLTGEYWLSEAGQLEKAQWIDDYIKGFIGREQAVMDINREQWIEATDKREKELITSAVASNLKEAESLFTGPNAKTLAGGQALMPTIVPMLAKDFYFDDRTKTLLVDFANSDIVQNTENLTAEAAKTLARNWLTENGAVTWADAQSQMTSAHDANPMQRTRFMDYRTDLENHITSTQDDFDSAVDEISRKEYENVGEIESALRVLKGLKSQYKLFTSELNNQIQYNYDTKSKWLDIGGKLYNQDEISSLLEGASNYLSGDDRIDHLIDRLEKQKSEVSSSSDTGPESRNEDWYIEDPSKSSWENKQDKARLQDQYIKDMLAFRSEFGLGQDIPIVGNKLKKFIKSFSETNAQLDIREFLDKFTETDGVNAFFMRNPEVFQEFIKDPLSAIKSNKDLESFAITLGYQPPK